MSLHMLYSHELIHYITCDLMFWRCNRMTRHVLQCRQEIQTVLNNVLQQFLLWVDAVPAAMNEYVIVTIKCTMNISNL